MEILKLISGSEIAAHIITFLALFFLLKKFAWGRVLGLLDSRNEKIASELKRIEEANQDAARLKADYEAKLSAIEEAGRAKINQAILEGQRIAQEIKDQAHNQAQRIVKDAEAYIKDEFAKAKEDLKNQVAALAVEAASRIIEAQITEKDSRRIVQDFLNRVSASDESRTF